MRMRFLVTISLRLFALIHALLLSLAVSPASFAFKMGIHDNITREELTNTGFDEDSADEAADSNY